MFDPTGEAMRTAVKTTRLIVMALIAGVVIFAAVVFLVLEQGRKSDELERLMLMLIPVFMLGSAAAYAIFQRVQAAGLRAKRAHLTDQEIAAAFFNRTIVGAALTEWLGFFSGIGFMLTSNRWLLMVMVGVVLVLTRFLPSRNRVDDFLRSIDEPA